MALPQLVLLSIHFIVCEAHLCIPGIALASVPWQSSSWLSTFGCLETPAGNVGSFFFYRKRCSNISKKGRQSDDVNVQTRNVWYVDVNSLSKCPTYSETYIYCKKKKSDTEAKTQAVANFVLHSVVAFKRLYLGKYKHNIFLKDQILYTRFLHLLKSWLLPPHDKFYVQDVWGIVGRCCYSTS